MELDTILQHKHLKRIFITIIGFTKRGYKVRQVELKEPGSRKRNKEKTAFYSTAEINDLFTKPDYIFDLLD